MTEHNLTELSWLSNDFDQKLLPDPPRWVAVRRVPLVYSNPWAIESWDLTEILALKIKGQGHCKRWSKTKYLVKLIFAQINRLIGLRQLKSKSLFCICCYIHSNSTTAEMHNRRDICLSLFVCHSLGSEKSMNYMHLYSIIASARLSCNIIKWLFTFHDRTAIVETAHDQVTIRLRTASFLSTFWLLLHGFMVASIKPRLSEEILTLTAKHD